MNVVERFCRAAVESGHLQGNDFQPCGLEAVHDLADHVPGHAVRLHDRQGPLDHPSFPRVPPERAASLSAASTASPISAGLCSTRTPHSCSTAIFSAAVPCPPAMIAPAWPIRLPGGAGCPATNATLGLLRPGARHAGHPSPAPP